MDPILQRDLHRLIFDTERIRQGLEKLGEDCASWARNQEEEDLSGLLGCLMNAEIDLSLTLSDSVAAHVAYGEDEARLALIDLHEAYAYLDALFNDIKKAATELNDAYIHPCELVHLAVDCRRLEKTIGRVQDDLEDEVRNPDCHQTE
jgi:hypothetical protein